MEKYLYLGVNLFTISFPLVRSFEQKIQYFKNWKFLFPAIFLTGTFFLIWDHWFTRLGVWEFNPTYILGIYFLIYHWKNGCFFDSTICLRVYL
ncbi:lycopene cyclase domain-containing protein [Algoriphagus halophilus]|uniref:lycopene cyclase domain-containing protein n=1 Tax=Algoriphagus halophilus TaxID=226505 RepID=UPI00358F291C